MFVIILLLTAIAIASCFVHLKARRITNLIDKFPGPPALGILGNLFNFMTSSAEDTFKLVAENHHKYGETYRARCFHKVVIFTSDPKIYEIVLGNPRKHLAKDSTYDTFLPWLGQVLVTSKGKRWHEQRKMLTPAFHFQILEQYIDVFDVQTDILVEKLRKQCDKEVIDILPFVKLTTLDMLCEAVMGIHIGARQHSKTEYVEAIGKIMGTLASRFSSVWKRSDLLFSIFARKDKQKINELNNQNETDYCKMDCDIRMTKKKTFLDILLQSSIDGVPLSDTDIREQVDAFMAAGFDTTTASITFALHLISRHPDVQRKLVEEIERVIGTGPSDSMTYRKLQELKYMDLVLKESYRMYPPVPTIGRLIEEDIVLDNGQIIPAKATAVLNFFMTSKNPKYFKDPHIFNPERFAYENMSDSKINPYTFVPFSAGIRNCIAQKYGFLETKAVVSRLLRHFELLRAGDEPDIVFEMVSHSKNGIQMGLRERVL